MNRKLYFALRRFFDSHPRVQPLMRGVNRLTIKVVGPRPITFSGWGMSIEHALPWDSGREDHFVESAQLVKNFEFGPGIWQEKEKDLDALLWRHWIVTFSLRFALTFAAPKRNPSVLVECGVAEGVTAFFALREAQRLASPCVMHLYDAWAGMRESELLESERWRIGSFSQLSMDRMKRNLKEFEEQIVVHPGHIPDTLSPSSGPSDISYLSIDLNSARPTIVTMEHFWPHLRNNAVVLFDDYGHPPYHDTRSHVDAFLEDKPGVLLHLPTGQAAFFHNGAPNQ